MTQMTVEGRPIKDLTVTLRYDGGACIRIRAGGDLAKAILDTVSEYQQRNGEEECRCTTVSG